MRDLFFVRFLFSGFEIGSVTDSAIFAAAAVVAAADAVTGFAIGGFGIAVCFALARIVDRFRMHFDVA